MPALNILNPQAPILPKDLLKWYAHCYILFMPFPKVYWNLVAGGARIAFGLGLMLPLAIVDIIHIANTL